MGGERHDQEPVGVVVVSRPVGNQLGDYVRVEQRESHENEGRGRDLPFSGLAEIGELKVGDVHTLMPREQTALRSDPKVHCPANR